jgi:hypothetical protein
MFEKLPTSLSEKIVGEIKKRKGIADVSEE